MPHDYYVGRIGGSRVWRWSTAPTPPVDPDPDSGISGRTIRRPYRLILGSPVAAQAFLWTTWRSTGGSTLVIASGGPRIFRRRGVPVV